jgi:hypothetical protein
MAAGAFDRRAQPAFSPRMRDIAACAVLRPIKRERRREW